MLFDKMQRFLENICCAFCCREFPPVLASNLLCLVGGGSYILYSAWVQSWMVRRALHDVQFCAFSIRIKLHDWCYMLEFHVDDWLYTTQDEYCYISDLSFSHGLSSQRTQNATRGWRQRNPLLSMLRMSSCIQEFRTDHSASTLHRILYLHCFHSYAVSPELQGWLSSKDPFQNKDEATDH